MTGVFEVESVEETWELAKKLAAELKPGDVVCLEGDLGAGKTTFTQGLAAALGVPGVSIRRRSASCRSIGGSRRLPRAVGCSCIWICTDFTARTT